MSSGTIVDSKRFTPSFPPESGAIDDRALEPASEHLAGAFVDKAYSADAIARLAYGNVAGATVAHYYLGEFDQVKPNRQRRDKTALVAQRAVSQACELMPGIDPAYFGAIDENAFVTASRYAGVYRTQLRDLRRNGAQRIFRSGLVDVGKAHPSLRLDEVPIAVIGAGAAGTLTARALLEMGFRQVDVLDRRGTTGGIWNQDNVRLGSKNNPFPLRYDDVKASAADDSLFIDGSGLSIQRYIHAVGDGITPSLYSQGHRTGPVEVQQALATGIEPGDLDHIVRIQQGTVSVTRRYPIVVYAPGIGRPLPVSHPGHMTSSASRTESGVRWQQQLTDEALRELEGQSIVLFGIGNSTAEMAYQFQQYTNKTGRHINYYILTHYPDNSLRHPAEERDGHKSLYRNLRAPELTGLAGDLPHINRMIKRAYFEGRIIGGITDWYVSQGLVVAKDARGSERVIPADRIYTLIGYGQSPKTLSAMGITCLDDYYGTGAYDFDGEVQRQPDTTGRRRLHPGYFVIGPAMKNRYNPNAEVIPGIQGQLNNLLTSIVFRAAEYGMTHHHEPFRRMVPRLIRETGQRALAFAGLTLEEDLPFLA